MTVTNFYIVPALADSTRALIVVVQNFLTSSFKMETAKAVSPMIAVSQI